MRCVIFLEAGVQSDQSDHDWVGKKQMEMCCCYLKDTKWSLTKESKSMGNYQLTMW